MSDDDKPAVERFMDDLYEVVDWYTDARLLSNAETVGALHLVLYRIMNHNATEEEEE